MIRRFATALVVAAAVSFVAACSGSKTDAPTSKPGAPDPSWVSSISQHSSGAISRHSPLRILFTGDVVPEEKVGTDAAANVVIKPAVKIRASFANRREIVIRPETEFAPNTDYRVAILAKGLSGVPADTKPFEFAVKTLEVNFAVRNHGLDVEYGHEELMTLRGSIDTADTENRENLEKILTAELDGKAVPITWLGGERQYQFTVANILRKQQEQQLVLRWDGKPLGVDLQGEEATRVPALDEFAVTQADAVQLNDQRQIQLRFSDAIDTKQDLKGLIRLSTQGEFTTSIQNNLLTLYVIEDVVGKVTLSLESAIRSRGGNALTGTSTFELEFTNTKPQVRFVGKGVILPNATTLSVPFEAVSARAVQVTAMQVFEPNIPQFLQVNPLSGSQEMGRVGRVLWRKTLPLTAQVPGRWTRYNLDVTELTARHPGALFQLKLSISPKDALFGCADESSAGVEEPEPASQDDADGGQDFSNWNYYEEDYYDGDVVWNERDDPCKPAYYRYGNNIRDTRNLLASNIGLIAKRASRGKLLVAATALDTSKPLSGVNIDAISYQNQVVASGRTDGNGLLELDVKGQPFALIADDGGRKGYLKVAPGVALPTSHFDVGGETVVNGLKGHLYGDRGVWRPGDPIYLTFALQDKNKTLPANHPVTLELRNPRGQLVQTLTSSAPVGQFYAFELQTAPDAPTGDWNALVTIGGASFSKTLKIETVMPNRLKIDLDLGAKPVIESSPLEASLAAQWLSGATAANLRAAVEVRLSPGATHFTRFKDFEFDDPARGFSGGPITVFDGELDDAGRAALSKDLDLPRDVPGILNATFITRVFERGGAFSINRETRTVAAFDRFVGVKMPKGDAARDMLLTDAKHVVELATVDVDGNPVSVPRLQVTLYKVQWRWWWEQSGDSLAQYAQSESNAVIKKETLSSRDGRGQWSFEIKYPEWGRYLVRVCDLDGGHCTGRVFYVDWPSWAGTQRDQSGPAANILTLTSDKQEYKVGETAVVQLPEASQGRALLTVESGSAILEQRWIEAQPAKDGASKEKGANRISIPITAAMAPNVYVAVTMIQPHAGKNNDRPIRLYGVVPLKVNDPQTRLTPVVTSAAEWAPQSKASISVSESSGRAMNYTLAVVDEGLLGLTNFKTPDLHAEFYKREALGILTWDLFDEVAGAYGGELDRLLALGGSDGAAATNPDDDKSRFPPVVKFLGPFTLKAGAKATHTVDLPQYVGAVRVMVVAGDGSAYGSADKSVFVRQALMILPTLPRVIGPDEQFTLPVSVFTADAAIKNVNLEVQVDGRFTAITPKTALAFTRPEEKLGFLSLKSGSRLGKSKIKVVATSGKHRAESEVWLEVRTPNAASSRFQRATLAAGETWKADLLPFGLEGTQTALLEVSALPPINLDGRLEYLIGYPHGCLEQTTSSVFPQLYLSALVKLDQNQRLQTENHVRAGIARLRSFQHTSGGFAYWPGVWNSDPDLSWREDWGTTYAGHFMLEAEKLGYSLPGDMKSAWLRYQKAAAQRWNASDVRLGSNSASRVEAARYAQAYRLYTLALGGAPEIGAMNRLRESPALSLAEKWLLASAYQLAGKPEVAKSLVDGKLQAFVQQDGNPYTFGSLLRDRAVVLQGLTLLGRSADADKLLEDVAAQLVSGDWYSTQSVAFALVAVAKTTGTRPFTGFSFDHTAGKAKPTSTRATAPLASIKLPAPVSAGVPVSLTNTSDRKLYVTASVRAVARSGEEDVSANGIALDIKYTDADGNAVDVKKLSQGMDLIAQISIRNTSRRQLDNLALTHLFPGGWEIRNDRLEGVDTAGDRGSSPNARQRFWWVPSDWRDRQRREAEYVDIRDDRVLRYFSLGPDESIFFETRLNAAYLGRFYLPGAGVEAMYDANLHARQRGLWVEVASQTP